MSNKCQRFLAICLLPAVSLASPPPDEIRYTFVDLGFAVGQLEVGNLDIDTTEGVLGGSVAVHPNIALAGSVGLGTIETSDLGPVPDIDTTSVSLGVVPHFPIAENVDIVVPVSYLWLEADAGSNFGSDDDSGYGIGLGIRALVNPSVELTVGLQHVDIGDDDEQSVSGSVRWHITSLVSLAIGGAVSSDSSAGLISGRLTF